ncbi:hypothetical protein L6V77_14990 [Myxococcota bacterium]|nr:hypothetical protein [Myxococcota bacterium]
MSTPAHAVPTEASAVDACAPSGGAHEATGTAMAIHPIEALARPFRPRAGSRGERPA